MSNKKIVFYLESIQRGGAEVNLLRFFQEASRLSVSQDNDNYSLVYRNESDPNLLNEFQDVVEVHRVTNGSRVDADIAIYCSTHDSKFFFESVNAKVNKYWMCTDPSVYINLTSSITQKYDDYLACSNYLKQRFIDTYPDFEKRNITVINPLVDPQRIISLGNKPQTTIDPSGFNIVTAARVCQLKGYDHYVEIAKILHDRGLNFKWYYAGRIDEESKAYNDKLRRKVREYGLTNQFIWLGVRVNPYRYMKVCDLSVILSNLETYCMVVAESKMLGLPIIGTNNSGIAEQLTGYSNGLLVNPTDYEMIADVITEMYHGNNRSLSKKILSDREIKDTKDTFDNNVQRMREFFAKV